MGGVILPLFFERIELMIKLIDGGQFCIAIQICNGSEDDGEYIIIRRYDTRAERDYAFNNAGRTGL